MITEGRPRVSPYSDLEFTANWRARMPGNLARAPRIMDVANHSGAERCIRSLALML
jgi:hypothetical protein